MRNTLAVLLPKEKPMQIIVSAAMLRDLEILALTGLFGGSPEAAARRII
jgi:mannose/fructose-specific phosphotransferase system component IIA